MPMPTPTTTPAQHSKQHKSEKRAPEADPVSQSQLAQDRQLCARPERTTATATTIHYTTLYPVPISRGHREESGGSCARPSTDGQGPPCSMRHTALAPLGDSPLLQKAADESPDVGTRRTALHAVPHLAAPAISYPAGCWLAVPSSLHSMASPAALIAVSIEGLVPPALIGAAGIHTGRQ
jgi:hypothetical protein